MQLRRRHVCVHAFCHNTRRWSNNMLSHVIPSRLQSCVRPRRTSSQLFFCKAAARTGDHFLDLNLGWLQFWQINCKKPSAKWLSGQTDGSRTAGSEKKSLKDLDFIVPPPSWQLKNHHLLRDFLSFSISNLHQEVAVTSSCKTRNTANFTLQLTPRPLATHYKTQRLVQGRSKVAQLRSAFICAQMLRILRRSLFLWFEDFLDPWRFDLFYTSPMTTFYSRCQLICFAIAT